MFMLGAARGAPPPQLTDEDLSALTLAARGQVALADVQRAP